MPIPLVGLEDVYVERFAQLLRHAEFEELTVTILLDVDGVVVQITMRRRNAEFKACAHHGKFGLNVICIHMFSICGFTPNRAGRKTNVSFAGLIRIRIGL
jgi:hypothetical protein